MRFLSDNNFHQAVCFCVSISFAYSCSFCNTGAEREDFYEQIPIMLRELLYRLNDDDESVLRATHNAFTALSKHVPAEELVKHVEFMRNLLSSMVSDARRRKGGVGDGEFLLPGFNMPRGTFSFLTALPDAPSDDKRLVRSPTSSWGNQRLVLLIGQRPFASHFLSRVLLHVAAQD